MRKILALILVTVMLASVVPVFATLPTQAKIPSGGGGTAPIVKAKWETPDMDLDKPWTQINPPGTWGDVVTVTYWAVVTDNDGWDNIDAAYVDVYHPNNCMGVGVAEPLEESFKYQVPLTEVVICDEYGNFDNATYTDFVKALEEADAGKSVKYSDAYNLEEVKHELLKCSAKAFKGTADLDYHQMCGEFKWKYECVGTPPDCEYKWTPTDMKSGYLARAYAYDKNGLKSKYVDNRFEYICTAGVDVDFTSLDFESVLYKTHKWIEGDSVFDDPKGPACKLGASCVAPTIRNLGNIPVVIGVEQDDMHFGFSGPAYQNLTLRDWNVQWDARLGANTISVFKPYEEAKLAGTLDLCSTDQISFSIYVKKPMTSGTYTGSVQITPYPVDFPFWTCPE